MKTVITYRKTPHAKVNTIFGTIGTDLVNAWCFEHNNIEDKLVKRWISKAQCYVKANNQDLPDYLFTSNDIRKYHIDVWNQKALNYKKYGKFLTNYELKIFSKKEKENEEASNILLNHFK